jgi:hypothetical protein
MTQNKAIAQNALTKKRVFPCLTVLLLNGMPQFTQ